MIVIGVVNNRVGKIHILAKRTDRAYGGGNSIPQKTARGGKKGAEVLESGLVFYERAGAMIL